MLTGAPHAPEFSQDVGTFTAEKESTRKTSIADAKICVDPVLILLERVIEGIFKVPRHVP
jgi:hypothetical protein